MGRRAVPPQPQPTSASRPRWLAVGDRSWSPVGSSCRCRSWHRAAPSRTAAGRGVAGSGVAEADRRRAARSRGQRRRGPRSGRASTPTSVGTACRARGGAGPGEHVRGTFALDDRVDRRDVGGAPAGHVDADAVGDVARAPAAPRPRAAMSMDASSHAVASSTGGPGSAGASPVREAERAGVCRGVQPPDRGVLERLRRPRPPGRSPAPPGRAARVGCRASRAARRRWRPSRGARRRADGSRAGSSATQVASRSSHGASGRSAVDRGAQQRGQLLDQRRGQVAARRRAGRGSGRGRRRRRRRRRPVPTGCVVGGAVRRRAAR